MKQVVLLLLASCGAVLGQTPWPDAATVAEVIWRANDYWIANNVVSNAGWARGAYYTGNQRAFRVLGERRYWTWANAWGVANQWKIGPEGPFHADAHCCGQTYIDLYRLDPKTDYLADIKAKMDAVVATNRVDYWWWIDAFYMAGPTLARLGNLTGDTNYFEKLWLMYDDMKTRRGLFDAAESLWCRDEAYIYPKKTTANGYKIFWSRGNGWVFAGLARVLQQMPANAPRRQEFVTMFQTMAPALKAVQGPDGMWRSSLYDAAEYPNPETSGTGFFTYGMAWGIRHGLLPAADYTNTVLLAWQGLTNLALNASGRVGYVQNVGAAPAAATESNTTDFGVGAFLLACSEILLLATNAPALSPWAGPDQTLWDADENGTESIVLDASQTEIHTGTAAAYTWWLGTNQFASGVTAATNLGLGTNIITLKVTGSDGVTYTDSMTVTVTVPVVVVPVLKMRFDFEDSGTTTTDSVAGVSLNLVNWSGVATDYHGALGTGVGGSGRALNFTSAISQGGNGPLASTVGNASIDFGSVNAFTITLWIKPRSSLLVAGYPRFFSLGVNGTVDRGTANSLQLLSNGNLSPYTTATAVQGFVNTTSATLGPFDMPTNQWRFLALTYDGTALNFYGGSETNTVALMSSASFPAGSVTLSNSWTLMIGNRISPQDRAFRGWFDDVRFYLEAAPLDFLEMVRQSAVAPPFITPVVSGTNLVFRANSSTNTSYILQATTNLTSPAVWTPISTNIGNGGPMTNMVPLNQAVSPKFFRYLVQ